MLHFSLQVTSISNSCKTQSTHIQITFIILSVYLHVSMHAPKKSQLLKTRGFCRIGVNIQKFFITRAKHSSKELRMILFETNLNTWKTLKKHILFLYFSNLLNIYKNTCNTADVKNLIVLGVLLLGSWNWWLILVFNIRVMRLGMMYMYLYIILAIWVFPKMVGTSKSSI